MNLEQLSHASTPGAKILKNTEGYWRFCIPEGGGQVYRLAQMDDYRALRRADFPWHPPVTLALSARASGTDLPGTWGFGLWNDPFGYGIAQGAVRLLPALPNAAWFFFASSPNYLSFRDDMPAVGQLAGVFRSARIPTWVFAPALVLAPLLMIPAGARLLRRLASRFVAEDAAELSLNPQEWHQYRIEWQADRVTFWVDDQPVHETRTSPYGPLGLVVWMDNQYAAWGPDGRLKYGTLPNMSAWIEIRELKIS